MRNTNVDKIKFFKGRFKDLFSTFYLNSKFCFTLVVLTRVDSIQEKNHFNV